MIKIIREFLSLRRRNEWPDVRDVYTTQHPLSSVYPERIVAVQRLFQTSLVELFRNGLSPVIDVYESRDSLVWRDDRYIKCLLFTKIYIVVRIDHPRAL